ncbi:MAG TPA: hypothetical protein PLZ65_10250 [Limnochordia bacterium]|nr:hypothetical protein [Limnochordia bacterium]
MWWLSSDQPLVIGVRKRGKGVSMVLKRTSVLVFVLMLGMVGSAFVVHAQQHTELTLRPIEEVRDYYFEYAAQHGWQKLSDALRQNAMSAVISDGTFVETASRLYTPRVFWAERMAAADYYFQDLEEAEQEFYADYYIDPAVGIAILALLRDTNLGHVQSSNVEFIVRDSSGKVFRDFDVWAFCRAVTEQTVFGITLYDAVYDLFVFGDFSEAEYIELFVLVDGMVGRAEHRWNLK